MANSQLINEILNTEIKLFEALTYEAMQMEIVSLRQLQKHFCLGFNQASRFMEYLATSPMFEETTVLAAKSECQDIEFVWEYLGLDPKAGSISGYKNALLERQNIANALKQRLNEIKDAIRAEKMAAKQNRIDND